MKAKIRIMISLALFISAFTVNAQYSVEVLDGLPDGDIKYATIQSKIKPATVEDSKDFQEQINK